MRKLLYSMLAPEGGEHVQKVITLLTNSVVHVYLQALWCTVCAYVCPVHVERSILIALYSCVHCNILTDVYQCL